MSIVPALAGLASSGGNADVRLTAAAAQSGALLAPKGAGATTAAPSSDVPARTVDAGDAPHVPPDRPDLPTADRARPAPPDNNVPARTTTEADHATTEPGAVEPPADPEHPPTPARRLPPGAASITAFAAITLLALLAGFLAPNGAKTITNVAPLHAPTAGAWFGTDEVGRDIFSRVLYGIRESWFSALAVILSGAAIGALIGGIAGAAGGLLDNLLMRITDLFLALPAPILAICVISALGPSLIHSLLALSIVWWPWYARIVRGEVRALSVRPHADAARLAGVSRARLLLRHLLPGAIRPVVVTMSLDVGNLILALAALSFIGLGAPAPSPELGGMSARGLDYLLGHAWVPLFPAFGVALLAFTANLAGDGLARLLDPRQRTRR